MRVRRSQLGRPVRSMKSVGERSSTIGQMRDKEKLGRAGRAAVMRNKERCMAAVLQSERISRAYGHYDFLLISMKTIGAWTLFPGHSSAGAI